MTTVETKRLVDALGLFSGLRNTSAYMAPADWLRLETKLSGETELLSLRRHGLVVDLFVESNGTGAWGPRDIDDPSKAIKAMSKKDTLRLYPSEMEVKIEAGGRVAGLKSQPEEGAEHRAINLSPLEHDRLMCSFDAKELLSVIEESMPFTSRDESRATINAMEMMIGVYSTLVTTTDSYRLFRMGLPSEVGTDNPAASQEVMIRLGDMKMLQKLLKKSEGDVFLYDTSVKAVVTDEESGEKKRSQGRSQVAFKGYADGYQWRLYAYPASGQFPDVDKLLPDRVDMSVFTVDRKALLASAEVAYGVLKEGSGHDPIRLVLKVEGGKLEVSGEGVSGTFTEAMEVEQNEGLDLSATVGVNVVYLMEALKTSKSEKINILLPPQDESGQILKPFYIGDKVLQMPMRVPGD